MMQGSNDPLPSSSIDMQSNCSTPSSIELPDISRFVNHEPLYTAQSPTSSVPSSNPKFTSDLMTVTNEYEYKAQQAEREQQRKSVQRQNQQEGHEV